jgi:YD repeat-containing protein
MAMTAQATVTTAARRLQQANRLDLDANWDYSYDDEGNLTGKVSVAMPTVTWAYTWDVNNRMVAAVKSAGSNLYSVDYKYDVFGNRIEQIEDADGAGGGASVTTRFAWEGAGVLQDAWGNRTTPVGTENWNIWADLNGSNGLVMRYVRGDEVDQLFSRVKADGTVAHYLTDRMQSTRQMLRCFRYCSQYHYLRWFWKCTQRDGCSLWRSMEVDGTRIQLNYTGSTVQPGTILQW